MNGVLLESNPRGSSPTGGLAPRAVVVPAVQQVFGLMVKAWSIVDASFAVQQFHCILGLPVSAGGEDEQRK
jgi:hypothetical protein